jgi:putative FmdB family regulatory protein
MPIYAYKCESCGFAKDVLQKMSDAPLDVCPACSQNAFKKQVTAAGFQLKGSGWYATDFKGGSTATPPSTSTPPNGGAAPAASESVAAAPKAEATPSPGAASAATGS